MSQEFENVEEQTETKFQQEHPLEDSEKQEPVDAKMITLEEFLENCRMKFALKPLQRHGFYDVPSLIRVAQPILRIINTFKLSDKELLELISVLRNRYIELCKSGQISSEPLDAEPNPAEMFETVDTDMYRCKECSAVVHGEEARNNHACAKWSTQVKRPGTEISKPPQKRQKLNQVNQNSAGPSRS